MTQWSIIWDQAVRMGWSTIPKNHTFQTWNPATKKGEHTLTIQPLNRLVVWLNFKIDQQKHGCPKDHWTLKTGVISEDLNTPHRPTGSFTRNHWRVLQILRVVSPKKQSEFLEIQQSSVFVKNDLTWEMDRPSWERITYIYIHPF